MTREKMVIILQSLLKAFSLYVKIQLDRDVMFLVTSDI